MHVFHFNSSWHPRGCTKLYRGLIKVVQHWLGSRKFQSKNSILTEAMSSSLFTMGGHPFELFNQLYQHDLNT